MPRPLPPAEHLDLVTLADIARGGMGTVELAKVRGGRLDGATLAVKRLNPELEKDPQFVNMFIDETWITAAIASPYVIKVEAWGKDASGLYLACELVVGVSLSRLIKESRARKEPFSERIVGILLRQICSGLEAAHGLSDENGASMNLVHRDLTPGNVLVGFDGLVKIADFGIAKANARLTETSAGVMKGKPSYMAPEQARGLAVDARADIFSLGVIAYELLAGQRPWVGSSDIEVLIAVSTKEPRDLSEIRNVSPVFLEIIRGCLQKDATHRFGSAREIGSRLDHWLASTGGGVDDAPMLRDFVTRNTPRQHAWFERALAGTQRGGDTFKDVEEQIDRSRKRSASQDPPHSVGRSPGAVSSRQPALTGPPISSGAPVWGPVSSAPVHPVFAGGPAVSHGAPVPASDDLAQTRYAGAPAQQKPVVMNLGGTIALSAEEMASAMSRRTSPAAPPSSPGMHLARTEAFPASVRNVIAELSPPPRSHPAPVSAPTTAWGPPPSSPGFQPMPGSSMGPSMGPPSPRIPEASPSSEGARLPVATPSQARGGGGKVIALLLVLALAAGAAAAYFLRARLGF